MSDDTSSKESIVTTVHTVTHTSSGGPVPVEAGHGPMDAAPTEDLPQVTGGAVDASGLAGSFGLVGSPYSGSITRAPNFIPSPQLRFVVPSGTTTGQPKLQQLWYDQGGRETEWRDIPTVVVD